MSINKQDGRGRPKMQEEKLKQNACAFHVTNEDMKKIKKGMKKKKAGTRADYIRSCVLEKTEEIIGRME